MDYNILSKKLSSNQIVYILDDFEEAAIRIVPEGNETTTFIKHKGRNEKDIAQSNETVFGITISGIEIDKDTYDRY